MRYTNATDAYAANQAEAEDLLAAIAKGLEDHMDSVNPETVDWSDAGSIGHVVEKLREVAGFLGVEESSGTERKQYPYVDEDGMATFRVDDHFAIVEE